MKTTRRRNSILAFLTVAVMLISFLPVSAAIAAPAAGGETVQIGQSVSYTGTEAPGYTFESTLLSSGETVGAIVFNISIDLPLEGDVNWNDWCGEVLAVRVGDEVKYYDFGGAQVTWESDVDGDDNPDTGGVGTPSWVGTAANGTCTIAVPVNAAEFSIDFYDTCWDSAADISHYTIHSATAVYGEIAAVEVVPVGFEMSYTGLADSGYVLTNADLTQSGRVAAVAFNISIALPLDGDTTWNDWCGEGATVEANGETKYYDFGGAQVSWGSDFDGDDNPDTAGVGTASWAGTVENNSAAITLPVNAEEFSISLYDNCWDTVTDITHMIVNSAVILYGSVNVSSETGDPEPETPAVEIPDFDPNGTYHAYLGVQGENWIFRNAWADEFYGANGSGWEGLGFGNNFNELTHTDETASKGGVFTDVEIKGNGTYRVELTDFDFGDDTVFNQLFVSTDIPLKDNKVSFSNVKVILDGSTKYTFDNAHVAGIDNTDDKDYYEIFCINKWNADLGGDEGLFGYTIPKNTIAIEFTVTGFDYDNEADSGDEVVASATPAPTPSAAPADNDDDGGFPWWGILLIIVGVVAVAVVVFLVIKKKK